MSAGPREPRPGCDMAALVEARRDGRVGEREAASLDRHLLTCASCRALAADLERLAGLAARSRIAPLSPLEQRRERLRLLRDAAFAPAPLAGSRSRVQIVRFAAAAAMTLGVLVGGTALALWGRPGARSQPAPTESTPGAPTSTPIHAAAPISAAAPTEAPIEPSAEAASPEAPSATAAAPAIVAALPAVIASSTTIRRAASRLSRAGTAPAASANGAAKPSEGASALADGVELIERGDYGAAAERLRSFRQSHPTDVRAEDAAFLAVLALERAGHHAAAVAAARDYLASYPKGYRRAEAQAIVAAP